MRISKTELVSLVDRWCDGDDVDTICAYSESNYFDYGYTAIDNTGGDMWVEEFATEGQCIAWLKGEVEINEVHNNV